MSLLVSKVPRSLEAKTRLFGFGLDDLVIIFLYLALSNLVFGMTPLKFPMVWAGTVLIASFLFFFKRGKPDHYLQHYGEYLKAPGVYSSGSPDINYSPFLTHGSK